MEGSDYNSLVYAWFEKSGIISNIRTQLRQNLVNALKGQDTTLNKLQTGPKSAKQYIYDLLIADYLWNHNYAYTLSVFASEAPLLVNFRKHVLHSEENTSDDKHHKLQSDYVLHTLETLGINPEDSNGQLIISEYQNNNVPLLLTILKSTCQLLNAKNKSRDQEESNRRYIQNCATQTETISHDILLEKNKIVTARKKLIRQKDLYNSQLREREAELSKRAAIIEEQMMVLNEKLRQAQIMMQEVNAKERRLSEERKEDKRFLYRKKISLARESRSADLENKRTESEQANYQIFETNLKKLQEELAKVQEELSTNKNKEIIIDSSKKLIKQDVCTQTDDDDAISNKIIKNNADENVELKNLIQRQQSRIEELTLRAIRLNRQLEEAQLIKSSTVETIKPRVQISKTANTVLSESSSTDDIIQDAKQRLKRLEEESMKADQSYFNCVTNLPLS